MEGLDKAVFLEIYNAYFRRVFNYVSYRINDHNDVDDLVSRVFMRVIEKHGTYDTGRGCVEAWIIGIARNAVTDYYREQGKREFVNLESLGDRWLSGEQLPEEIIVQNESQLRLMKALSFLNERERNVIALKYGAELSNRQIAQQLNLSVSNIGVILFRSLRKLRGQLGKEA